jgi:hypothetical protein
VAGLLDPLPGLEDHPRADATHSEGVLSVVLPSGNKVRRLPALYFGQRLIFADRDIPAVVQRLQKAVSVVLASRDRPAFSLHACEIDGRRGLYARDVFNRSPYRRRLMRLGMRFASDPYTTLTERGSFACDDWGEFSPEFMIFGYEDEDPSKVVTTRGAMLPITAIDHRIGPVTQSQLHLLIESFRSIEAVSAKDSEALVAALRSTSD